MRCGWCCTDPTTIVTLTKADLLAIVHFLDLSFDEVMSILGFYHFSTTASSKDFEKLVTAPIQTEKGLAILGLLKESGGRCIYLERDNSCAIYPTRPKVCRTFPFTFSEEENKQTKQIRQKIIKMSLSEKGGENCPGLNAPRSPLQKPREWKRLGAAILRDISEYKECVNSWNSLVKAGEKKGSARAFIGKILADGD